MPRKFELMSAIIVYFTSGRCKRPDGYYFIYPASVLLSSSLATEGLSIYFFPVEENKLITLHRPVILFNNIYRPSGALKTIAHFLSPGFTRSY